MRVAFFTRLAIATALLAAWGCNGSCIRNSDCPGMLVCMAGACAMPIVEMDADIPDGEPGDAFGVDADVDGGSTDGGTTDSETDAAEMDAAMDTGADAEMNDASGDSEMDAGVMDASEMDAGVMDAGTDGGLDGGSDAA